jgi:hypothetical protein
VPQENFLLCHHSLHRILDFLLNLDFPNFQIHLNNQYLLASKNKYHYLDFLDFLVILDFQLNLDFLDFPILTMHRHHHRHHRKHKVHQQYFVQLNLLNLRRHHRLSHLDFLDFQK